MEGQNLSVLWTSGERDVALKVVLRYIETEIEQDNWGKITLIIWGPSVRLAVDDEMIREKLSQLLQNGLVAKACVVCAEDYDVCEGLKALNIPTDFVCEELTHIIQEQQPFVSF